MTGRSIGPLLPCLAAVVVSLPCAARASDSPSAQAKTTSEANAPGELLSLRLSGGMGAAGVGPAAQTAAELDYWILPNLGVGVTGALGYQTDVGSVSASTWLLGPGLVLRSNAGPMYWFGAAAFGAGGGRYSRVPALDFLGESTSEDEGETRNLHGYAALLTTGGMTRVGFVDLGGALSLNLPIQTSGDSYFLVTANFIVGLSLPRL